MQKAVQALLEDPSFRLDTIPARSAYSIAEKVLQWIASHNQEALAFEEEIVHLLDACIVCKRGTAQLNRKHMWLAYHTMRVSNDYKTKWKKLLLKANITDLDQHFISLLGTTFSRGL